MPAWPDQAVICRWNQFASGWPASKTQPAATSAGRKPIRKTPIEIRGTPHFVQPPTSCDSAIVSPAPARMPYTAQYPPTVPSPIWVEIQISSPATPAPTRVNAPRTVPTIQITSVLLYPDLANAKQRLQQHPAGVEARGVELGSELVDEALCVLGEHVFDHADRFVVSERQVDVLVRDQVDRGAFTRRTAHGDAEALLPVARRKQEERRGEDGPGPLLRIAEEAPGPVARLDAERGQVDQLTATSSSRAVIRFRNCPACSPSGAQSRSSCVTRPGCSSPHGQSKLTR